MPKQYISAVILVDVKHHDGTVGTCWLSSNGTSVDTWVHSLPPGSRMTMEAGGGSSAMLMVMWMWLGMCVLGGAVDVEVATAVQLREAMEDPAVHRIAVNRSIALGGHNGWLEPVTVITSKVNGMDGEPWREFVFVGLVGIDEGPYIAQNVWNWGLQEKFMSIVLIMNCARGAKGFNRSFWLRNRSQWHPGWVVRMLC